MPNPGKTVAQYEAEALALDGCLLHPSANVAHKVYRLRHGTPPAGMCVCHTCDIPQCIRDEHHFLGTKKDNTQDAVTKGRHSGFRKGGIKFAGNHTEEAKQKIADASRAMWANRADRSAINRKAWETRRAKASSCL